MKEALKLARKAEVKLEAPIGALIVMDGKIIAKGYNTRESKADPLGHAEIMAIKRAAKKLKSWRLSGCEMYVTLEPCTMCAGAIIQARIDKIYIGAMDPKAGAAGSVIDIFKIKEFNHRVEVESGILKEDCSKILKDFFKSLRNK